MKTLTTSMILSVMFLSAGAFAHSAGHGGQHPLAVSSTATGNVTVVTKNATWPPAGQISVQPCKQNRCIEI